MINNDLPHNLFFVLKMYSYKLRERDEESLSKILEPFNTLDEYINKLDEFKWVYAENDDCDLHEDLLEWIYDEIDKLKAIKTAITKDDMEMVNMVFDRTIGKYHYDAIIEALKEDNEYYMYLSNHPEAESE